MVWFRAGPAGALRATHAAEAAARAAAGPLCCSGSGPRAQDVRTADWSEEVAPFWGAVIRSALSAQGFAGLFKAGWTTIKAWLYPSSNIPASYAAAACFTLIDTKSQGDVRSQHAWFVLKSTLTR